MNLVLALNLAAIVVAAVTPNEMLMWHSYVLYGLQLLTMIPHLLGRARLFANLFMPTFFVLVYYLVNLTLGSYLVPRGYGWDKQFATTALDIQTYNVIVPFLMIANVALYLLTLRSLNQLQRIKPVPGATSPADVAALLRSAFYFALFFAISYADPYSVFSFQLAVLLLHLTDPALRGKWYRYVAYAYYLAAMVGFNYENKREIAIALFLITFLETYYSRMRLRLAPAAIVTYLFVGGSFLFLVIAASILRGYGDFPVASIVDAIRYIPQYAGSAMFVDGITDNLELNYNYGAAITAMDHGLRGLLDYQYGASLIKPLFLAIPRDAIDFKPESTMQLFTRIYAPDWWVEEGSLPVMFAADMFLNFNYLGIVPFVLLGLLVNHLFLRAHTAAPRSFVMLSCIFLFITILMLARGGGVEQWLLYYMLAAPLLVLLRVIGNNLRADVCVRTRWVV